MKISKLAFIFTTFAITAISNVSLGMNPQKDLPKTQPLNHTKIEEFKQNIQEKNAEHILQNKLNQLKEEKEKEKNSWFNKIYLHKLYDDKESLKNDLITGAFGTGIMGILYLIFKPELTFKNSIILISFGLCGDLLLDRVVQEHQTHIKINSEKIKNLEEVLEEMNKNKFSN